MSVTLTYIHHAKLWKIMQQELRRLAVMDNPIISTTTTSLVLSALVLFYVLCRKLQMPRYHDEPPYIPSMVPVFGHVIGLFLHKMAYYKTVK